MPPSWRGFISKYDSVNLVAILLVNCVCCAVWEQRSKAMHAQVDVILDQLHGQVTADTEVC